MTVVQKPSVAVDAWADDDAPLWPWVEGPIKGKLGLPNGWYVKWDRVVIGAGGLPYGLVRPNLLADERLRAKKVYTPTNRVPRVLSDREWRELRKTFGEDEMARWKRLTVQLATGAKGYSLNQGGFLGIGANTGASSAVVTKSDGSRSWLWVPVERDEFHERLADNVLGAAKPFAIVGAAAAAGAALGSLVGTGAAGAAGAGTTAATTGATSAAAAGTTAVTASGATVAGGASVAGASAAASAGGLGLGGIVTTVGGGLAAAAKPLGDLLSGAQSAVGAVQSVQALEAEIDALFGDDVDPSTGRPLPPPTSSAGKQAQVILPAAALPVWGWLALGAFAVFMLSRKGK